ncbi:MAG: rsbT antagonist protein RsbS [Myxococcota bacterium]|jgi:rsbT antagonist protein RsbS
MSRGRLPILRVAGNLLVAVNLDLDDASAEAFQHDVLDAIERRSPNGLVIDISGLEIVDTYVARVLADTASMARLMGVRAVVAGMRPEVAATLVQMGFLLESVHTALDVDDALAWLGGGGR